jgi:hypothetical protein
MVVSTLWREYPRFGGGRERLVSRQGGTVQQARDRRARNDGAMWRRGDAVNSSKPLGSNAPRTGYGPTSQRIDQSSNWSRAKVLAAGSHLQVSEELAFPDGH